MVKKNQSQSNKHILLEESFKPKTNKIDFSNPPAGKVYVPIPTDEDDIRRCGIDKRFIVKHKFSATTMLCKMVLIDKCDVPAVDAYIADIKAECKKNERKNRCKIKSPKTGKAIYCPESISCYSEDCPLKKRELVDTDSDRSIEELFENSGFEIGGIDFTSSTAQSNLEREEFICILKKADPVLADIYEMRDYGYEPEEIMEKHNLAKSTYYYQLKRIRDRWEEYNAD